MPHIIKLFQVSFLSGTSNSYLFFSLSTDSTNNFWLPGHQTLVSFYTSVIGILYIIWKEIGEMWPFLCLELVQSLH